MKPKKIGNWIKKSDKTSEEVLIDTKNGKSLVLAGKLLAEKSQYGKEKALAILNDMGFRIIDSTSFVIVFRKNIIKMCDTYFEFDTVYLQID